MNHGAHPPPAMAGSQGRVSGRVIGISLLPEPNRPARSLGDPQHDLAKLRGLVHIAERLARLT